MARIAISKKIRFEVLKRDKFTCQYCGKSAPEVVLQIDHIVPVSKGGKNGILNLLSSCTDCNAGKSSRLLDDNSTVTKQKNQADLIQERKNQIELLAKWYQSQEQENESLLKIVEQKINHYLEPYDKQISDSFKKELSISLKKYSLHDLIMAVEKSFLQYLKDGESTPIFIDKILKIAYWQKKEADDPDVAFRSLVVSIAQKKWWKINRPYLFIKIKDLMDSGFENGRIINAVNNSSGIVRFEEHFRDQNGQG